MVLVVTITIPTHVCAQIIEGRRGSDDFKIGVAGFTYRNFDIQETLDFLKSLGVGYLSVKEWWLPLDSTVEQMEAFKKKCSEYGVEGYILGPVSMKDKSQVDRAFAYAGRYGASMFIGVPEYDLLPYVIEKVKETGIKVAIHTHGPDGEAFPDIRTIVGMVKDPGLGVGCCMDLGHSFRSGYNLASDIRKYSEWIYDIHIKDETACSREGRTWEMGRGVIDFRPVIKALRKIEYKGVISVELEKNGDNPHPGVAESVGYLRGLLDSIR